ncbi:3570_t:CDS:2 [Gigaspora rosea]|nr:3570_t:CDS:2 [Gigaspora rosea]
MSINESGVSELLAREDNLIEGNKLLTSLLNEKGIGGDINEGIIKPSNVWIANMATYAGDSSGPVFQKVFGGISGVKIVSMIVGGY